MAKVYIHSNQINIKSKSLKFDFELISIVGDMLVFDWLFGYRKKKFFWERSQREQQRFDNKSHHDEYSDRSYSQYHHNDYVQLDFNDDLDSGMFDDDF